MSTARIVSLNVWKHGDRKTDAATGKVVGGAVLLAITSDLSHWSLLKRRTIAENLLFMTRTVVERVSKGHRASVALADQPYMCHVHVQPDGLTATVLTAQDYNARVAFQLLGKTLKDFGTSANGADQKWQGAAKDNDYEPQTMKADLVQYAKPETTDTLMKTQQKLDEIKDVLATNLDLLLAKGEKLEELAAQSEQLSEMSKQFYKGARKTHGCCTAF